MLAQIDTLIIDLQIVGCRVYTFKATIDACLQSAKKFGKKVVVLDRPNPLGGVYVEGALVKKDHRSFVGPDTVPMRHAMTAAEAAQFFNRKYQADLEVVALENWQPEKTIVDYANPWTMTSPNLPAVESLYVYPGAVLLEGTSLSEGRGTTMPFQLVGAPDIDTPIELIRALEDLVPEEHSGIKLIPWQFRPTFHKWQGMNCHGVLAKVTRPETSFSYFLYLALISQCMTRFSKSFALKQPPYEYEYTKLPMDILLGDPELTKQLANFDPKNEIWSQGSQTFIEDVKDYLIYDREMKTSLL